MAENASRNGISPATPTPEPVAQNGADDTVERSAHPFLGEIIRHAREQKGWRQPALASRLGLKDYRTIIEWEKDSNDPPGPAVDCRLPRDSVGYSCRSQRPGKKRHQGIQVKRNLPKTYPKATKLTQNRTDKPRRNRLLLAAWAAYLHRNYLPSSSSSDRDLERMGLAKLRTIRGWRREGRGPRFIKVEHSIRYRLSDVLAYLDSRPGGGRVIAKPVIQADTAVESK